MTTYTTNVPPPVFGPTGFTCPTDAAILTGVQADMQGAFGGALNFTTQPGAPTNSTPQAQLADALTAIVSNVYSTFKLIQNLVDPAYTYGRFQDGIGRIYFLTRFPALPTILNIACSGGGVTIPAGAVIQDESNFQYTCVTGGAIPPSGSVTLQFANTQVGPNPVPETDDVSIVSVIPGWDSVTCLGGTIGQNTENSQQFETRRAASVAGNSQGAIGSIIGAVAKVPGIIDWYGFNNTQNTPQTVLGVVIPANSIYICASGGTQAAIAQAILSKLGGGCGTSGNTTVTAFDSNPLYTAPIPYTIKFQIPTSLQILVAVSLVAGPDVPSNAATLVQNQIIAAAAGTVVGSNGQTVPRARIASLLLASEYINAIQALGSWVRVRSLYLGSINDADAASFTGVISSGILTSSSETGTIAIGQTVLDIAGNVPEGTTIVSGTDPTWTLSNLGLNVTSEPMFSVAPLQNSVQVQADQEPSFVAANIVVTVG